MRFLKAASVGLGIVSTGEAAAIQIVVLRVIAVADAVSAVVEAELGYLTYAAAGLYDQGAGMELDFAVEDDSESAAAAAAEVDVVRDFSGADGEEIAAAAAEHSELGWGSGTELGLLVKFDHPNFVLVDG